MVRKSRKAEKKIKKLLIFSILILIVYISILGYMKINKSSIEDMYHSPLVVDEENKMQEDWKLVLVNKWNPITTQDDIELIELSNGEFVDERIYPYLQKMFDDAREEGIYPIVASGYRTEEEQQKLYDDKIAAYKAEGLSTDKAKKEAELWVAIPGTSEHQLGLAVDINADGIHSMGTEVYEWLADNAHHYGFIQRYPANKTDITGVSHEPWHYRYVGEKVANEIYSQDICFEEYINKKIKGGVLWGEKG